MTSVRAVMTCEGVVMTSVGAVITYVTIVVANPEGSGHSILNPYPANVENWISS
jgi:hypothetical protein